MPVIILTAGLPRAYGVCPVEVRHPLLSVHTGALQAPGDPDGLYSRYAAIGGAGGPADAFGQVCKPDIYSHMGWGSFIIGFALLTVFYIIALHKTQKEDLK
ncbi:hypothetical protein ADH66_19305 [Acutalibacter muris]|uniref:Uncharacterized protein n=1 Tax=Acutalibacter muris TaxID=1796620 RepID=A0ABN5A831_9FIRM|nr:hypothetical protein A4V00_09180 [Hungateiclostridiaceae bacterium KB18]ASB42596.1 hypothetical protein ADH66_19305 [Acutalibacter muris]